MTQPDTPSDASLDPTQLATTAQAFRLLGDPTRLRIVLHCLGAEHAVGDIASALGLSQTLVSHHLRLLRAARLVSAERRARHVFYRLSDAHVTQMISDMADHVKEPWQP